MPLLVALSRKSLIFSFGRQRREVTGGWKNLRKEMSNTHFTISIIIVAQKEVERAKHEHVFQNEKCV